MDVMTDDWVIDNDGNNLRQISEGFDVVGPPAFTPAGDALALLRSKMSSSISLVKI